MAKARRPDAEQPWLIRTPEGFSPASAYDRELIGKYGIGARVRAELKQPRSGRQQRWYRALVRVVWRHQEHYASPDALHFALKVRMGLVDDITLHNGEVVWHASHFRVTADAVAAAFAPYSR